MSLLELLCELISRRSLTPTDAGCSQLIADTLTPLGFEHEWLYHNGVTNLWSLRRCGREGAPLLVFAGHTDVVPPGDLDCWNSDPFTPTIVEDVLYGRGAADMKSGLAAMVTAVQRLHAAAETPAFDMAFLLTSDEEGPCRDGTRYVAQVLGERGIAPDYVIVGEATADERVGDRYIVGRRGSLGCNLSVQGVQGHVAYPHKARNPIHQALPALAELAAAHWDDGNADFPPTSFQIANFHSGTGATNVIPGEAQVVFNFRYAPCSAAAALQQAVTDCLDRHGLEYQADWWHTGEPYHTPPGLLTEAVESAIEQVQGRTPLAFTGGGTSDGRFLAPLGAQVVELGPVSASIHKHNEHIRVDELDQLCNIYIAVLRELSSRLTAPA